MKYFIAGSLEYSYTVVQIERWLKEKGHEITFSWAQAYLDKRDVDMQVLLENIKECDVFGLFMIKKSRGCHIELGSALVLNKPSVIYCPCPQDMIKYYQLGKVTDNIEDFKKCLINQPWVIMNKYSHTAHLFKEDKCHYEFNDMDDAADCFFELNKLYSGQYWLSGNLIGENHAINS
jgi:hypothetical protein